MQLSASLSHGVFISYVELGILISGPSGIGKSDSALELIQLGAKLICDDAPRFRIENGKLMGYCAKQYSGIMHIRGLGLIHIPSLFDTQAVKNQNRLDLIIQLHAKNPNSETNNTAMIEYESLQVQEFKIPILNLEKASDRPMGLLISTAIKQFKLRMENHDPCQKLIL